MLAFIYYRTKKEEWQRGQGRLKKGGRFSDDLHLQRIHNQLKHIRMSAAAGVIEVKRIVSNGVFGEELDQLSRMECICQAHTVLSTGCRGRLKRVSEKFLYQYFKNGVLAKLILI